jgi:hypothetical protein
MKRNLAWSLVVIVVSVGCGGERGPSSQARPAGPPSQAVSTGTPPPDAPAAPATIADLVLAAQKAERAGDMPGCIRNEQAALALRESARARLRLASCESRAGKLVAAYANTVSARDLARRTSDADTARVASARAEELEARLPTIEVHLDAATSAMLDGEPLANGGSSVVDPGAHELVVTFVGASSRKTITVVERDAVELVADAETQTIAPAPPPPPARKGDHKGDLMGGF